eukprot:5338355-Karenia_brevis.AAC.1
MAPSFRVESDHESNATQLHPRAKAVQDRHKLISKSAFEKAMEEFKEKVTLSVTASCSTLVQQCHSSLSTEITAVNRK